MDSYSRRRWLSRVIGSFLGKLWIKDLKIRFPDSGKRWHICMPVWNLKQYKRQSTAGKGMLMGFERRQLFGRSLRKNAPCCVHRRQMNWKQRTQPLRLALRSFGQWPVQSLISYSLLQKMWNFSPIVTIVNVRGSFLLGRFWNRSCNSSCMTMEEPRI